jgi:hypothetical protein
MAVTLRMFAVALAASLLAAAYANVYEVDMSTGTVQMVSGMQQQAQAQPQQQQQYEQTMVERAQDARLGMAERAQEARLGAGIRTQELLSAGSDNVRSNVQNAGMRTQELLSAGSVGMLDVEPYRSAEVRLLICTVRALRDTSNVTACAYTCFLT